MEAGAFIEGLKIEYERGAMRFNKVESIKYINPFGEGGASEKLLEILALNDVKPKEYTRMYELTKGVQL